MVKSLISYPCVIDKALVCTILNCFLSFKHVNLSTSLLSLKQLLISLNLCSTVHAICKDSGFNETFKVMLIW